MTHITEKPRVRLQKSYAVTEVPTFDLFTLPSFFLLLRVTAPKIV